MVAPTRTPQVRGVKCDLCKKILASATWLDQTKLAKTVDDAKAVLDLINQHEATECPCIPKNIENLLIGSTHFEIHRLVAKRLDTQVHQKQYELYIKAKQKAANELSKNVTINDCNESQKTSRFKIYSGLSDSIQCGKSKHLLQQLIHAIDFWKLAMEDQANPFNQKLALRLGLTHHVIYACYLFKYYKKLDYQLITANLLLNLFKSIEGVTANAVLHANYLLVKSLMDCNQLQQARQCLKQAAKIPSYQDKTHYESILLTCASCELSLLDCDDSYSVLDELANLAMIKPDDKLQHYYARTLAVGVVMKYIHRYPARSDLCFEFYHTFRYICAIIRRCYESSFELVLFEKDVKLQKKQQQQTYDQQQNQILDHSWIRFAVCDFAFSTFDLLSSFYMRAGQPEALELLYNGLNLVAYRNGSCYWQSRMAILGANLDSICDKFDDSHAKLDNITRIMGQESDFHLMNLLRLDLEVSLISLLEKKKTLIKKEVVMNLLQRIKTCQNSLTERLFQINLFDCHANTFWKTIDNSADTKANENFIVLGNILGHLSLRALKIAILSMLRDGQFEEAKELVVKLADQFNSMGSNVFEYNDCQTMLEILIHFADVDKSDQLLLEAVESSQLFLETGDDLGKLESQLSMLTIGGGTESNTSATTKANTKNKRQKGASKTRISRLNLKQGSRRRGIYDVACQSQERDQETTNIRFFDTIESVKNLPNLTKEELVVAYLRNSEPNPDYLLYRHAHELMFCLRLKDQHLNQEQLMYHFCESSPSNTMRYRWMMFEEQQVSPYEPTIKPTAMKTATRSTANIKHLAFSGILADIEKIARSFVRIIPEDFKLIQMKHIVDRTAKNEHLLIVCFDNRSEPIFMHAKKPILSDDFFEDADKRNKDSFESLTMSSRFATKIQEAKKTLFNNNQRSRTEQRQKLEKEIGLILHDLENDWLGSFKFLLCGRIFDLSYNKFIDELAREIQQSIMAEHSCNSIVTLKTMLENASLLNRDEFCKVISSLFNCASTNREVRDCFNKWLKSFESFIIDQAPNGLDDTSKTGYLQTLNRGQVGLILDKELEPIPFESLPILRIVKQGIFRIPSLRLFNIIASRNCPAVRVVDIDETVYMLDPASNLAKTRERFENKLRAQESWLGTINRAPTPDQLEQWFSTKQVYLFIGHGAGTDYYNGLCKGRGLSALQLIKPTAIVMGCSSGRVLAEGPKLESFGIGWVFVFRGSPSYVGLLWDVTDTDIDKFLDSLLEKWMGHSRWPAETTTSTNTVSQPSAKGAPESQAGSISSTKTTGLSMAQAAAQARHVCQLKFLVGSTPVIYGLPVWCK